MAIRTSNLTKGQLRKLTALRKSLGNEIADKAFSEWLENQPSKSRSKSSTSDPVAVKLVASLAHLQNDKTFKLGNKGYAVKRVKGRGVSGFVATRITD